jgi:hypothetical protein
MTYRIPITEEAEAWVLKATIGEINVVKRRKGYIDIDITNETFKTLMELRQGNETFSDTIIRLAKGFIDDKANPS